jgi:hypothetical protein
MPSPALPRQQAEAAQRDFIASTLRYESGAAISNSEFENQRKIYFPQPGDSAETVALKAKLRENAIEGLRLSAGPAAPKVEGADYSGMTGGPDQTLATGATRNVSDPGATAALSSFIKSGAPYDSVWPTPRLTASIRPTPSNMLRRGVRQSSTTALSMRKRSRPSDDTWTAMATLRRRIVSSPAASPARRRA